MKIIKNQYFFFIILSALLLILGISFCNFFNKENEKNSDAGYKRIEVSYSAAWRNPDDELGNGNYLNTSGDSIDVSCGALYATVTNNGSDSGWSSSGTTKSITTKNTGDDAVVVAWFQSDDGWGSGYNCTVTGVAGASLGFSLVWSDSDGKKTFSGSSPMFNDTDSYIIVCVFYPYLITINYDVNGGIWSDNTTANKSESTYYYERYSVPSNPSRKGYTFVGFKTDSSGGTEITSSSIFKGDTSIYANWTANKYNITFNKDGGSGGASSTTATYNSTVPEIDVPSRTGYKFQGYYTSTNGKGTRYYDENGDGLVVYQTAGNITLYAHWKPIEYKVQYNSNDGTGSTVETGPYEYDESFALAINKFKRMGSGYCFGGWKKSPSATSPVYTNGQAVSNLTTAETTVNLYVHWVKEQYTILYYATQDIYTSGGNAMSSATVTYGASYTFPIPTRTGYLFDGWKHATTSEIYNGSGTIPDWGNDGDKYIGKKAQLGTEDNPFYVPLYATWTPITYKINFDANTGSGSMESMSKTFDTPKRLSSNRFTKEGYNFVGWSLDPQTPYTCEDTIWQETLTNANWSRMSLYTIQNTVWTQSYSSNPSMGGDIYFVTGSDTDDGTFTSLINSHGDEITIYALWEAVDYQIVFDGNGATDGSMINLAMIYDVSKTLTNFSYTKDGCLFLGWHRVKDATTPEYLNKQSVKNIQFYDEESKTYRTVVEGDKVKLYAVWKETWAINNEKPNGSGTVADPYLISTPQELAWISYMYETATAFDNSNLTPYFLQTANIDLSEYEWLPIADSTNPFGGTYDGNGYVIKNIQTYLIPNVTRAQIGLFGFSNAGTIKNVRLFGDVKGNTNVGGILGMGQNVTFENCTNFSTITATQNAGGIAGFVHGGKYLGCYNYGDISATNIAGGIVGRFSDSTISNCYVNATINGANSAGLASYDQGSTKTLISSCAFEGNCGYGAIVGYSASTNTKISNCFANCSVTDDFVNYGLCAGTATIENCVFEINGVKRCLGNDFSAWVISSDGRPFPSGLSWLAIGGTKVTNISQITVNYTKVG